VRTHLDLIDLVLTAREDAEVDGLLIHLKKFQSVTKHLQKSHVPLNEALALFDDLYAFYPELHHLSPAHAIVPNKPFESAIMKVIAGREQDLSAVEARLMERFKTLNEDSDGEEPEGRNDYAEAVLDRERKRRRSTEAQKSEYIPLDWIPSTNNENERVFSKNKHVFSDIRRAMNTNTLETLMFLKADRALWDLKTVHYIIVKNPQVQD
jgi:hypothetical protein